MKKLLLSFTIISLIGAWSNAIAQTGIINHSSPIGYTSIQLRYQNGIGVDAQNNIWYAFSKVGLGMLSHNGISWIVYDTINSPIASNVLTCLYVDGNTIYAGTMKGLSIFDGSVWTTYNISNSGIPDNNITCVTTKNGILLVGTKRGFAKYDGITWQTYSTQNSQLPNDTIQSLLIADLSNYWIGSKGGLTMVSNNIFTTYTASNSDLRTNDILCISKNNNGDIWIGTYLRGVYKITNNIIQPIRNLYPLLATKNDSISVYSIAFNQDGDAFFMGNTWGNNNRRLIRILESHFIIYQYNKNNAIMDFDSNDILWITSINTPVMPPMFQSFDMHFSTESSYNFISANNINALFNCAGSSFWDLQGSPHFEVPKNSGKNTLFSSSLWIGGTDVNGGLHLAAEIYEGNGKDFFPGPVMDSIYYQQEQYKWNRVWNVTKQQIDDHINNWQTAGYIIPVDIAEWPGNGDTTKGQAYFLAPYHDTNGDGKYTPQYGDYPLIKGDQTLFYILNDDANVHSETGGAKLKTEIHVMAYEYACLEDSALWNTLFVNYKIINKSTNTYTNTYLGNFVDMDIGNAKDDFVGCDVQRGAFYGYNGNEIDGTGLQTEYGANPPAQAVVILAGSYQNADGIDNPAGIDYGINGNNYSDNIVDNERLGLSSFFYFNNGGVYVTADPSTASQYYNYLKGNWIDSTYMMYGGNGYGASACGPRAKFMYPGDSDSLHWGTNYQIPTCNVNDWTEETVGNVPADRRGLGTSGPFTFLPGAVQNLDIAYVYGRGNAGPASSIQVMKQRIDSVRYYFNNNTYCGTSVNISTSKLVEHLALSVSPNPASTSIAIKYSTETMSDADLYITDVFGKNVFYKKSAISMEQVDLSNFAKGLYIVKLQTEKRVCVARFIKQ